MSLSNSDAPSYFPDAVTFDMDVDNEMIKGNIC